MTDPTMPRRWQGIESRRQMEWTTEKPTKPGFYWAIDVGGNLTMLRGERNSYGGVTFLMVGSYDVYPWQFDHFMGPLDKPEPPARD